MVPRRLTYLHHDAPRRCVPPRGPRDIPVFALVPRVDGNVFAYDKMTTSLHMEMTCEVNDLASAQDT